MPQTFEQTTATPLMGDPFAPLRAWGAAVLARLAARRRQAETRAALARLSDAQLRDVGAEGWGGDRAPPLAADAATMRRLMSLR